MSDLIDVQVQLYPEILRRMAAGEKLAGKSNDDTEKLAAALLVADAIEKDAAEPEPEIEKKAVGLEIGLGSLALGAMVGPALKRGIQKLRGIPALPEGEAELVKSFRSIIEARSEADAAKRKLMLGIGGGALAGAAAAKLLDKKQDSKAAAEPVAETKKEAVAPSNTEKSTEKAPAKDKSAHAVLGRLLKACE